MDGIRSSLAILNTAPHAVTVPPYAALWRAVLGPADYAIAEMGPTGGGKTAHVAVILQHHGAGLDDRHMPASWSSTANALEGITFEAKDALLVIDDFAPVGTVYDIQRMHREAARLIRGQGNRSGRQRMWADSTLWPTRHPRGTIIMTGEDVPRGHSVRARLLIIELGPNDMDWGKLTEGADINAKDLLDCTPPHWAVINCREEVVELLLAEGAEVNPRNRYDRTPLLHAIYNARGNEAAIDHYANVVRLLLAAGADANGKDRLGMTPLYEAALVGSMDMMRALLDNGADVNAAEKECGRTPLHVAAESGRTDLVKLLLDRGADVDARDGLGATPLHLAADCGNLEVMKTLLDRGADVDADGSFGNTPLGSAAIHGDERNVRFLLERGANPDAGGWEGQTPLHGAAFFGDEETVRLLLERGADVNIRDDNGATPLDEAVLGGYWEVAALLHRHGGKRAAELT